jgi:peptidyl-tRNA hydrolase
MVFVVNMELKMGTGKLAAQVIVVVRLQVNNSTSLLVILKVGHATLAVYQEALKTRQVLLSIYDLLFSELRNN